MSVPEPASRVVYKSPTGGDLSLHVFLPKALTAPSPAIVFFFGGGWRGGSPGQFYPQAAHFAELGIVCFSAEYRTFNSHGTTPFDCVTDAKSAIRWVRANAAEYGVDPQQVISAGGSAGGHLALCTSVVPGLDDPNDNLSISCVPQAVIAFNPVADTSPAGYGSDRLGERWREISPLHHVGPGAPPALIFHGLDDTTVPIANVRDYRDAMLAGGNRCQLVEFPGCNHGFFNFTREDQQPYYATMASADRFLAENGFID